jgi:hypothetical protein
MSSLAGRSAWSGACCAGWFPENFREGESSSRRTAANRRLTRHNTNWGHYICSGHRRGKLEGVAPAMPRLERSEGDPGSAAAGDCRPPEGHFARQVPLKILTRRHGPAHTIYNRIPPRLRAKQGGCPASVGNVPMDPWPCREWGSRSLRRMGRARCARGMAGRSRIFLDEQNALDTARTSLRAGPRAGWLAQDESAETSRRLLWPLPGKGRARWCCARR